MKIKTRWTKNKCQFRIFSFNNNYEKQAFLTPSAPLVLQAIPSYYMREKGLINNSPSTRPLGICMSSSNNHLCIHVCAARSYVLCNCYSDLALHHRSLIYDGKDGQAA